MRIVVMGAVLLASLMLAGCSEDDHSDTKGLAAQRILNYSEVPKAAQNVGLRSSEQMKGYVDHISRINEREVNMAGWLMDPQGKTPLDVLVFIDGSMVAATQTKGERPDITTGFHLGSGAEKNVAFSLNVNCRPGDEPVVVGVGERKQYIPVLLYQFKECP